MVRITPIVQRRPFCDISELMAGIEIALDQSAEETKALYEKTVATWNNPPSFAIRTTKTGRTVYVTGNKDAINHFKWTDQGTRQHVLEPRGPWPMVYSGYKVAKTKPGVIYSYKGSDGEGVYMSYFINHPGTEARMFSYIIQQRVQSSFNTKVKRAVQAAIGEVVT